MNYILKNQPSNDDVEFILNKLSANAAKLKFPKMEHYIYFAEDCGINIAGIECYIYYGCLYIDQLFVDEKYQNNKIGTKLILKAEQYAIDNFDIKFSTVNTMSFEAKSFYEKNGYEVEFIRDGYLYGSKMLMLRKNFC